MRPRALAALAIPLLLLSLAAEAGRDESGTGDRDRYGRLLRYVVLPDGTLLNAEIVRQGYGHAYLKYPFSKMEEFRSAEEARDAGYTPCKVCRPPVAKPPVPEAR